MFTLGIQHYGFEVFVERHVVFSDTLHRFQRLVQTRNVVFYINFESVELRKFYKDLKIIQTKRVKILAR